MKGLKLKGQGVIDSIKDKKVPQSWYVENRTASRKN